MFKRNKIEVVQPRVYSKEEVLAYCSGRSVGKSHDINIKSLIPSFSIIPLTILTGVKNASANEWSLQSPGVVQTGVVADASLTALATILQPIVDILVAISFPIASVIVVCAFFLVMIGNKEKAFDMMMHAGLGYILIQLSPVFLEILKTVGETF